MTPKTTWLVVDAGYAAHRAYFTPGTGAFSFGGNPTGVLYGMMSSLAALQGQFDAQDVVLCWDGPGPRVREAAVATYKAGRREAAKKRTEEQEVSYRQFKKQLAEFRDEHAAALGYANSFTAPGFEADDVIAQVVRQLTPEKDGRPLFRSREVVVVTGDHDMYQCVGPQVSVYHPREKETVGPAQFLEKFGIPPSKWPQVKALAGCGSDEVVGIKGVGEASAAAFLRGDATARIRKLCLDFTETAQYRANLMLVTLPHPDCPEFPVTGGARPDPAAWDALCRKLGFNRLHGRCPGQRRGLGVS